ASAGRAVDRDVAVQHTRDPAAHGEAEAGAAALAGFEASELAEQQALLLLRDPGARVDDVDGDPLARPRRRPALALLHAHRDRPRLRVLQRVREQVAQHLTDASGVALDGGQLAGQLRAQREPFRLGLRAVLLRDAADGVAHVGG